MSVKQIMPHMLMEICRRCGPLTRPRRYRLPLYAVEIRSTRTVADVALDDGVIVRHNYIDYGEALFPARCESRSPAGRGRASSAPAGRARSAVRGARVFRPAGSRTSAVRNAPARGRRPPAGGAD